jgi:hypothetical protein
MPIEEKQPTNSRLYRSADAMPIDEEQPSNSRLYRIGSTVG